MVEKIEMPISMAASNHSLGNILYYYYKRNKNAIELTIQVGAGSNSRSVRDEKDNRLEFAHWGCGTSLGIRTHLSEKFLVIPDNMLSEAESLKKQIAKDPWKLITCDPNAIVVTPYHRVWSQLIEMTSKLTKGTCGSGAGRAYAQAIFAPEMSIRAIDLKKDDEVEKKLRKLRSYVADETRYITKDSFRSDDDRLRFLELQCILNDLEDSHLEEFCETFRTLGRNLPLCATEDILNTKSGTSIVEHSHGVLSDSEIGFKPYVSSMRCLPQLTDEYLKSCGFNGEIRHYAVHSAYEYRHGPGPMPTFKGEKYRKKLGIAPAADENRWRGPIRTGYLDIPQLVYAINSCGGPEYFDGFWLTCFDRIMANPSKAKVLIPKIVDESTGEPRKPDQHFFVASSIKQKQRLSWNICTSYYKDNDYYQMMPVDTTLTTELLLASTPYITNYLLPDDRRKFQDKDFIFSFIKQALEDYTGIALDAVSYGTGEERKIWSR